MPPINVLHCYENPIDAPEKTLFLKAAFFVCTTRIDFNQSQARTDDQLKANMLCQHLDDLLMHLNINFLADQHLLQTRLHRWRGRACRRGTPTSSRARKVANICFFWNLYSTALPSFVELLLYCPVVYYPFQKLRSAVVLKFVQLVCRFFIWMYSTSRT